MKSLQKQLTYTLSVLILLILGGLWWAVVSLVHYETEEYILNRLSDDASSLPKHLFYKNNQWHLALNHLESIYQTPSSGHYFVIRFPHQTILSPSLNGYPLYTPDFNEKIITYETKGQKEELLYVRAEKSQISLPSGKTLPLTLYVAEDHGPIHHNLMRFDAMFAIAVLLTLGLLFAIQKLIIKKTFSTLKPLEEQLERTEHSSRPVTIQIEAYPIEIQSLLQALQNALQRLQKQLITFRKQNANLAHSLKTPINVLYQKVDALPSLSGQERQALQQQLETLTRLVERELKKARISEGVQANSCFHLQQDLPPLLNSIQTLYQDKSIQIETALQNSQSCLPIEKEDGYELLGNLLDNAAKWCKKKVKLSIEKDSTLIIEDDGSGVEPAQLQNIRQRGIRLDETTPGHGIGLSIVEDIAQSYEIELHYSRSQLGGLKVQLRF